MGPELKLTSYTVHSNNLFPLISILIFNQLGVDLVFHRQHRTVGRMGQNVYIASASVLLNSDADGRSPRIFLTCRNQDIPDFRAKRSNIPNISSAALNFEAAVLRIVECLQGDLVSQQISQHQNERTSFACEVPNRKCFIVAFLMDLRRD
jgi:hypothetical protein